MQILLASAKIMRERCRSRGLVPTEPLFHSSALPLVQDMARKGADELSELFTCSPEIAQLNRERYQTILGGEAEIMPAVLTYYGQAYKHLKADTLSNDDLLWAQKHLWISSCLWGLLRPLDGISPYRMEGGFALPCTVGSKVNEYWREKLTDTLIESVLNDDGVLVYLDTEEFRALFDWKRVVREVRLIIEPEFHVIKNGRMTTTSVWAKTCRGAMTRYIIENRITRPDSLKDFMYEGFAMNDNTEGEFVYTTEK